MKKTKNRVLLAIYVVLFLVGICITLNSVKLAELKSRQYINESSYLTSDTDIARNNPAYIAVGVVFSLLGGSGFILTAAKD